METVTPGWCGFVFVREGRIGSLYMYLCSLFFVLGRGSVYEVLCNNVLVCLGLPLTYPVIHNSVIVVLNDVSAPVRSVSQPSFSPCLVKQPVYQGSFDEDSRSRPSFYDRCTQSVIHVLVTEVENLRTHHNQVSLDEAQGGYGP